MSQLYFIQLADYVVVETAYLLTNSPQLVARNDAGRVAIRFTVPDQFDGLVSTQNSGAINKGILVKSTVDPIDFLSKDFPGFCQAAWYGRATTGNATLNVYEVFYRPSGSVSSELQAFAE